MHELVKSNVAACVVEFGVQMCNGRNKSEDFVSFCKR